MSRFFSAPAYRCQVFAFKTDGTFGIGTQLAEFDKAKNIGYADTLNDVPESFFTIDQDDPKLAGVFGYEGRAHLRILRNDEVMWAGWFGMEHDSNERDVIFTNYGYLAGLYWLASDWNITLSNSQIDAIVTAAWTRAKTIIDRSPLNFVATGTIEAPVTTSGGATPLVLPTYTVFYKRLLYTMREMAALGIGDTTNTVVFEITHAAAPTFNFWKNRGTTKTATVFRYGDDRVAGFRDYQLPVYRRNDLLGVGATPTSALLRYEWTATTGEIDAYGRRQEPVYFQWVRDQLELQRGMGLRGALSLRTNPDLTLRFHPNSVIPPGATGAEFRLSDSVRAIVSRGVTQLDDNFLVSGYRVLVLGANEHLQINIQQNAGT